MTARICRSTVLRLAFASFCLTFASLLNFGCRHSHSDAHEHSHGEPADGQTHSHAETQTHSHGAGESWAVTTFGELYEIFAEADPLSVGAGSRSHTHVTVIDGFEPLLEGRVEAVLSAPGQADQVFSQNQPVRPGIFDVILEPRARGSFSLSFRILSDAGEETIDAGQVNVGTAEQPGHLVSATFSPPETTDGAAAFLKEQQWQTPFATTWVKRGELAGSVRGPATVRPPAGGEVVLTAPVDGTLALPRSRRWPFAGADVEAGERLFAVVPRRTDALTPATLEAEITGLQAELDSHRKRLERLDQLLAVEAVDRRSVEELRARIIAIEADLDARRQDLAAEQAARRGGAVSDGAVAVRAPFAASVAAVEASPGETVSAGMPLARLVVRAPVWVEVRLSPADAAHFAAAPSGLLLRPAGAGAVIELPGNAVQLVARRPEVNPKSGTVGVIFAVDEPPPLLLPGVRATAEVLLAASRQGVVIPRDALVDDAGVDVVYVQSDGETFVRREVTVLRRQGERLLVSGLEVGERLVTRGGVSIRRSTLLTSSGAEHGHVH